MTGINDLDGTTAEEAARKLFDQLRADGKAHPSSVGSALHLAERHFPSSSAAHQLSIADFLYERVLRGGRQV